jgi:hypothetical protein
MARVGLNLPAALLGFAPNTITELLERLLEFRELRWYEKIECPFQLGPAPQLNDLGD